MRRRRLLQSAGVLAASAAFPFARVAPRGLPPPARELDADAVVIGGGLGGCAAALTLSRRGLRVILTEETDWIGGQLTSQAVPPDEHPWIEAFGGSRSYRELRAAIRQYYRDHYPLTASALRAPRLNPGNGRVSALCHEPRVALAALEGLLAPHRASGRLMLLLEHVPRGAEVDRDRIRAVEVESLANGRRLVLRAPTFLDATELGDLLPLTGTEHVTGFEARGDTGEARAPAEAQPSNEQAFTLCFALEHRPGEDHTIDRPEGYAQWHDRTPVLRPPWPGPLLSLVTTDPLTGKPRTLAFDPEGEARGDRFGLWTYRRILDRTNFAEGAVPFDVSIVNWPQNDFWEGSLLGPVEETRRHVARARELGRSLLYWLQTEAPRPDGGVGFPGLRLRPDITGTEDGFAKRPYVREARRIRAVFTVTEEHVGTEARARALGKRPEELSEEAFPDSVGVGSYRIDLHPSTGGDNYIDVSSLPFQIPLGALLPVRVENLLPAAKNLGVTHITNGCYRLHPVEWGVGEAAGALAAHALRHDLVPRAVRQRPERLAAFQGELRAQGVEIEWPRMGPR